MDDTEARLRALEMRVDELESENTQLRLDLDKVWSMAYFDKEFDRLFEPIWRALQKDHQELKADITLLMHRLESIIDEDRQK